MGWFVEKILQKRMTQGYPSFQETSIYGEIRGWFIIWPSFLMMFSLDCFQRENLEDTMVLTMKYVGFWFQFSRKLVNQSNEIRHN